MKKPLLVTVVILFLILLTKQSQAEDNWYYVEIQGSTTRIIRYNSNDKEYINSHQISMKLEDGKIFVSVTATTEGEVCQMYIRDFSNRGLVLVDTPNSSIVEVNNSKLINGHDCNLNIRYIDPATSVETTPVVIQFTILDRVPPDIKVTCTETWGTSQKLQISSTSNIGLSTLILNEETVLPVDTTSFTVYKNGIYTFKATDILGDVGTYAIEVSNIDINAPSVDLILSED